MKGTTLERAIKDVKEHWNLNRDRPEHWDDEDDWGDDDAIESLMDECGMMEDGCSLAGTEHCDWDCPFE